MKGGRLRAESRNDPALGSPSRTMNGEQIHDMYGAAHKHGSAILMARLVAGAGKTIDRASVDAIEYSIYELDARQPGACRIVAGHDRISLNVEDVLFDTLQKCSLWRVDGRGYNFRHEIDVSHDDVVPTGGKNCHVRYELTPKSGPKTVIRFQLRVVSP